MNSDEGRSPTAKDDSKLKPVATEKKHHPSTMMLGGQFDLGAVASKLEDHIDKEEAIE